jgi:hypothetical protein
MKKKYDAVATVGKYKNNQGEEKKRYLNVGTVFEGDDGRLSMKMEALPISTEWSGWVSFYELKQDGQPRQNSHNEAKSNGYAPEPRSTGAGGIAVDKDTDLDDIPF